MRYKRLIVVTVACSIPTTQTSAAEPTAQAQLDAASIVSAGSSPISVELASDGKALQPIVTGRNPSQRVQEAAKALALYLARITGAQFEIASGDGVRGIAVGLPGHFPCLSMSQRWTNPTPEERQDYLLRSHSQGVHILGATDLAVEHGVWDLLYRLGYRQFFPGKRWEVVPEIPELSIAVDSDESPDYVTRRIWYGFGLWDYNQEPYLQWRARNRATSAVVLRTGHAYGGIIRGLKKEFDEHPEFYALVDGNRVVRPDAKLCIGNPDLRRLVAQYAISQVSRDTSADSISMDPSDGGGWCQCDQCTKLGTISDRALLLANEVAAAVNQKHPGKLVGIYAYNYHSPPPNIKPHPQVVVSVATAFLKGGLSLDEIITGWSGQGAILGIREYYSVNTWDRDMPGQARGSNLDYLRRTIPDFHRRGARFMSAESSDNWGCNGLGYYVAARMLWDTEEAEQLDELVDDFLTRAFDSAKTPMADFYRQLDGSRPHLVFDDQLGRMLRALKQARDLADNLAVRGRVDDLILYTRYVDLNHRYQNAKSAERQKAFEQLIRHAYRMRTTMLIHTKALYRDLVRRDKTVSIPPGAEWNVAEVENSWKTSEPFGEKDVLAFLTEGIARHPLTELDFEPVEYGGELLPASKLNLPQVELGDVGPGRNLQTFITFVEQAPATIELQITGGLIPHYRDRGNVRVELWKVDTALPNDQQEKLVATDQSVPPDGVERAVEFQATATGLHKVVVQDGGDRTRVTWSPGQPMTVLSGLETPMNSHYTNWSLYFYVPKATEVIGLYGGGHGEIHDAESRPIFWLNGREPNFYSVSVPHGQDGKLWRIRYGRGPTRLLTVPPFFARNSAELLLPKAMIESDAD